MPVPAAKTLFISDLHLDPGSPEIARQFLGFLDGEARAADALYILGDLNSKSGWAKMTRSQRVARS